MAETLTIDSNGGISLPSAFMEKFRLKPGAKLVADLSDEGMALRPDHESGNADATLVDRDGLLVFTGTEPFDAGEAVMTARWDRDDELSASRAR
ncbi:MAG TPA: AbrB/MazE/SpoVT family DNA-binding domain-containing protein [Verrucomicrobiales bacterium]|nr:AbrB/MazE/SpoVT family DNA-binding domain-containing protein [Verrucomicrobiales bacterium]